MSGTAVVAAGLAVVLAAASHAKHSAQVVVAGAAGCALLAALSRGREVAPSDWLTVRLLLAGNLAVFGISSADTLGVALAAVLVINGVALVAAATYLYIRQRGKSGRGR